MKATSEEKWALYFFLRSYERKLLCLDHFELSLRQCLVRIVRHCIDSSSSRGNSSFAFSVCV